MQLGWVNLPFSNYILSGRNTPFLNGFENSWAFLFQLLPLLSQGCT